MKITALETLQLGEFPNLCLVCLHTDEGLVGLGETFFGAPEVATYLHESAAPRLLGQDPTAIDELQVRLQNYVGTRSTGVEGRGNSAVDLALWDLAGKATGHPVCQLLGGASREAIRVYNTCAGSRYVRAAAPVGLQNWGLPARVAAQGSAYEDLDAWLHGRGELARSRAPTTPPPSSSRSTTPGAPPPVGAMVEINRTAACRVSRGDYKPICKLS
jgi:galactonate dehydratase